MGEPRTARQFVRQSLVLALIMLAALGLYLAVLWWRGPHAELVTWTLADEWLPFRPEWVWVYLCPYLVGPVAVGLLSRDGSPRRWGAGRWRDGRRLPQHDRD